MITTLPKPQLRLAQPRGLEPTGADADTVLTYALALRSLGQLDEALARSLEAIELSEGREDAVVLTVELMQQKGRSSDALELARKWVRQRPAYSRAHIALGAVLQSIGNILEAIESYETALRIAPTCSQAVCELVLLLIRHGRPADAAQHVQAAAAQLDDPLYYYVSAATVFARGGFSRFAECFLQRAEELDPADEEVRHMASAIRGHEVPTRASTAYVQSLFDRHAPFYDMKLSQANNAGPGLVEGMLQTMLPDRRGLNILDAGCGTGLCGNVLRNSAAQLVGIDVSREMLSLASNRGCYDKLVLLDLAKAGTTFDSAFDLVVCSDVLIYQGLLEPALSALRASLRDSGCLILTVEADADTVGSAGYTMQPSGRYKHTADYVQSALKSAGFCPAPLMKQEILRYEYGTPVKCFSVGSFATRRRRNDGI